MSSWKLSETEKNRAIENIVKQGVTTPMDRIQKILGISKICSFRILFFGIWECIFLGILITVCLWMFGLAVDTKIILCSILALSPVTYISLFLLTTWKEHITQLYEVKMSCRYTLRQITALRMMYFSCVNMMINAICLVLFVNTHFEFISFWKTLGLSFSSLFLYGVIMLAFQIKGNIYLSIAIPPVIWGIFNVLTVIIYGEQMEKILLNLTGGLIFMIFTVLLVIYMCMLFVFFNRKHVEETRYVVS